MQTKSEYCTIEELKKLSDTPDTGTIFMEITASTS